MKKDVATQQACGCDLHSSFKPETWKLHHHLGSFHPRCLTSKVMSAWPPNLTNMVSGFRIHLPWKCLGSAGLKITFDSVCCFFLSKGWAMEEKARPRIVAAERQRFAANALRKKEVAAYHFPAGHRFIWRAAPHCILGWTAGGFMVQGTQFLRPLPPRSPSECRSTVRSTWSLRARSCWPSLQRRFPNTSVELVAKSEEKPEKSPNLAIWVI